MQDNVSGKQGRREELRTILVSDNMYQTVLGERHLYDIGPQRGQLKVYLPRNVYF